MLISRKIRTLVLIVLVLVIATGCGSDDDLNRSTTDPAVLENERTIGNPAVYERIAGLTSCTALQQEFDIAMDNAEARQPGDANREVSLSYANAADTRMQEIGCYG